MIRYRRVVKSDLTPKQITSHGIILYSIRSDSYLLTRRRHSAEFVLICKCSYRLSYLNQIVKKITEEERLNLISCKDRKFYKELYVNLGFDPNIFNEVSEIFYMNYPILLLLLPNKSTKELEWTWPKGRPISYKEDSFDCAVREFNEEVNIQLPDLVYLSNLPLTEPYETYSHAYVLENRYWLCITNDQIDLPEPKNSDIEVSKRAWIKSNKVLQYLPHYSIFKDVQEHVNKIRDSILENSSLESTKPELKTESESNK